MISPSSTRRLAALALAALVASLSLTPVAASVGNEATIVQEGDGAAAVCQLAILVRAVVVLDLEDSLALVARKGKAPVGGALGSLTSEGATHASCDVLVGTLRIVVPAGESIRAGSYVSGPPSVGASRAPVTSSAGGDIAVCQLFLLIDSVIITGGAYGLPTGTDGAPLLVGPEDGHASCRVEVGEVEIVELPAEGVELDASSE